MCSICPNNCVHAWEGFDFSDLCVLWAFQLRSTRVSTFVLYQQKTNWKNLLTKCVKCYQVCHLDFTKCYKVSPRFLLNVTKRHLDVSSPRKMSFVFISVWESLGIYFLSQSKHEQNWFSVDLFKSTPFNE